MEEIMKKKPETPIDFTKIDWNCIDGDRLLFYFNEAVEANNTVLNSIGNINDKAYQFLAIACTLLAVLTGFLFTVWGEPGKEAVTGAAVCACAGFGLIFVLLLLALCPRTVYPGRAVPAVIFSGNLYKAPMANYFADGIASYHQYICLNRKVAKFRSLFLAAGMLGFLLVPLATIAVLLCKRA
jgi:hypothetical protein